MSTKVARCPASGRVGYTVGRVRANRWDLLWLAAAVVIFGGLDLLVYGTSPPTTGWAGPHAALLLQLSVDVSLLFLTRFPMQVASWALAVAVLMLASEEFAPGLFTPVEPAAHAALPYATPAIIVNLIRLTHRHRALVLIGLLAGLGTQPWDPSWDITPLGVVNTVLRRWSCSTCGLAGSWWTLYESGPSAPNMSRCCSPNRPGRRSGGGSPRRCTTW